MLKKLMAVLMFLVSNHALAEIYFPLGAGLDLTRHDKSSKTYPLLNFKGGVGYKVTPKTWLEFDVTSRSSATYEGEGTCTTTFGATVSCSEFKEVSRQMITGSAIYHAGIKHMQVYFKGGLSIINSTFRSGLESPQAPSLVTADEKDTGMAGYLGAGILDAKHHRIGVVVSTKYGNDKIGNFVFFGAEYNFLLSL